MKSRKTHCKNGHELVPENTRQSYHGGSKNGRKCKECDRIKKQNIRESKRVIGPKVHCKHGHLMTNDNLYSYLNKYGKQVHECKICAKIKNGKRASQLRENHLMRKFGINLKDFDKMLSEQGGVCAACHVDKPRGMGEWHVDHCHKTNKIRGLLCVGCNTSIAAAQESSEILRKLADYLDNPPYQIQI